MKRLERFQLLCILIVIIGLSIVYQLYSNPYSFEGFHHKNKNLNIVINSYKDNTVALEHLLSSLKKCHNFGSYKIYVFIGGYYDIPDYETHTEDNITFIKCNNNSIDFTGLIGILEHLPKQDEYYFYLHDTCLAGENFINIIDDIDLTDVSSLSIKNFPSMNIGIYSNQIIHDNKDVLFELKNVEHDRVQEFKKMGVEKEDIIFRNNNNHKLIQDRDHFVKTEGPKEFYNSNVKRLVEYYDLDLYKLKSNWERKDEYELKL